MMTENGGIFVCKTRQLQLAGGARVSEQGGNNQYMVLGYLHVHMYLDLLNRLKPLCRAGIRLNTRL